jgi:hypothetical protein
VLVGGEFCFAPIRGSHGTASARAYHWKAIRAAAGWEGSLYLATRHFAGWYVVNLLELPSEGCGDRARAHPTAASWAASSMGTVTASVLLIA